MTGRSLVVFQPHCIRGQRLSLQSSAVHCDAADEVFVLDVYGAREQPLAGISGASIAEHVSVPVRYLPDFSAVAQQVAAAAGPGDVIVTMGAGDVTLLGPEIVTALRVRANRTAPGHPGVCDERTQGRPTDRPGGRLGRLRRRRRCRRRRRFRRCSPRQRSHRTAGSARRSNPSRPEFEGPRRRARRNAASAAPRRIVPARSRKPAARPKQGVRPGRRAAQPVARSIVRGLKLFLVDGGDGRVGVGLGLVLYFTPRCLRATSWSPGPAW